MDMIQIIEIVLLVVLGVALYVKRKSEWAKITITSIATGISVYMASADGKDKFSELMDKFNERVDKLPFTSKIIIKSIFNEKSVQGFINTILDDLKGIKAQHLNSLEDEKYKGASLGMVIGGTKIINDFAQTIKNKEYGGDYNLINNEQVEMIAKDKINGIVRGYVEVNAKEKAKMGIEGILKF